ncbi:DUF6518 family protein [Frigoribacterium sp. PvP032]|uniref:DUF6518 family protein n=1 Tax=Frigoribacterium sp. PvP032 TaxID=2806589 RepID=UPI001AE41807|nr:DUF6518 family protein [Frigoribacterium sp. PvP032]MBP1189678.1 hypothetical protein [Frigoribacterium sp. PvP032]
MTRSLVTTLGWWLLGASAGLVLGGATSFGQQHLPDGLRPFANSSGGWTVITFATVVLVTRRPSARRWWTAAGLGLVVFHAAVQGYVVASTLRGFPDSYGPGDFWFTAATLAGPVIGLAGLWWWSPRPVLRAVGVAILAAVMIGDGVSGLVRVAETTGTTWWLISIAVGVVALGRVVVRQLDRWRERALAVGLAGVGAAAFVALFSLL